MATKEANWWHDHKVKDMIRVIQDPSSPKLKHATAWQEFTTLCEKLTNQLLKKKRSSMDPWELSPTWMRIANDFDPNKNTSSYSFALQYLTWDVGIALKKDSKIQVPTQCLPSVNTYEEIPDEGYLVTRTNKKIHWANSSTIVPVTEDTLHQDEGEAFGEDHWDFLELLMKREVTKEMDPSMCEAAWHFHKWVCSQRSESLNESKPPLTTRHLNLWRVEWQKDKGTNITNNATTKMVRVYQTRIRELWQHARKTVN